MQEDSAATEPTPSWGDTVMPEAGAERQKELRRLQGSGDDQAGSEHSDETGGPADNPLLTVAGRQSTPDEGPSPPLTTPLPQTDAIEGNWAPLLGPGNEAMQDGSSAAPRGYTGGAMGRTAAGLSPSFPIAASGAPPNLDERAPADHETNEE